MEYKEYLREVKGFSEKTIEIYCRYSFILEANERDYLRALSKMNIKTNNTRRIALSAFKSYYKFKKDERSNEIELPKKDIKELDYVTFEQYKEYTNKINKKTKMGFQKYIIVRLLFETGVRASELLWILKEDIIGSRIKIRGKGSHERHINISKWLLSDIEEYLKTVADKRLFKFGYKNLRNKVALLDKDRSLTPHMFRRGYAKYCFKNNISIYDIALSMGHTNINTTASYIKKKSRDVEICSIFS